MTRTAEEILMEPLLKAQEQGWINFFKKYGLDKLREKENQGD